MAALSSPTYTRNNPLYHAAAGPGGNTNGSGGGGSGSGSSSRGSHRRHNDAASSTVSQRESRASHSKTKRPTAVHSNLPPASHAARPGAAGNHRSRSDRTPERGGRSRSRSRGRTSSRTGGSHGGSHGGRDNDNSRGRRGLEDVGVANDGGGDGDGDVDGDGDGSGSIVSGFSLMRETPQRHRNRSRSRGRSRSASRGRRPRQAPRLAAVGQDVDLEDGREGSGAAFLKDAQGYGGGGYGRVGGGSGSVGGAGGGTMAAGKGMEPAVKGCGVMTTATFLKLVTFAVMVYYAVKLWTVHYDPSSGRLCSFRDKHMCVTSPASKVLLTISRMSAGALFPSIVCCILSKCYATRYFLHHSWLALVVSFEPAHELHTYFGTLTLSFGVLHAIAHMARTVHEGQAQSLVEKPMDRSGLAALVFIVPIACPMLLVYLKKSLSYEFRKALHMLFIPFTVAMCFHGGALRATCAILLVWYLLDRLYFTTRMSFCIERPILKPVGRGTFVRFDLPPGYHFKVGAYIQVNCPAISATEWHPFSIFPVPGSRARAGFHAEAVGDWTQELFRLSLGDLCMPIWITAAQPSVLEKSIFFDNVMLVCTGAGITPAVSLADMFCKKKNVHLMWLSREAGMIAMFEKQLRRVKSTVHLTGKPSLKTKQRMVDLLAPSKGEVIATTAIASHSRSSSYADLSVLGNRGAGGGGDSILSGGQAPSYRGELREGDEYGGGGEGERGTEERSADDGWDDSVFGGGGSALGGVSELGVPAGAAARRGALQKGASSRHHRGCSTSSVGATGGKRSRRPRVPFGHPISINFGRPDIEKFIAETVQGTAVEGKWAPASGDDIEAGAAAGKLRSSPPPTEISDGEDPPPTKLRTAMGRKVLQRLTTNQRITKRDLMSADLSVIASAAKESPQCSQRLDNTSANTPTGGEVGGGGARAVGDPKTWLVLYCGANAKVEKAVATACDDLGVTWRKEYFSSW